MMFRFSLFLGAFLLVSVSNAEDGDLAQKSPPYIDAKTGLKFSDVDGFVRGKAQKFDRESLGFSVGYNSPNGLKYTVYVYDMGLSLIPDGEKSLEVQDQISHAVRDIKRAKDKGYYNKFAKLKSDTLTFGKPSQSVRMKHVAFDLEMNGPPLRSHLFVTGHNGHFVKVRCTFARKNVDICEIELKKLNDQLARSIHASRVE